MTWYLIEWKYRDQLGRPEPLSHKEMCCELAQYRELYRRLREQNAQILFMSHPVIPTQSKIEQWF